MRQRKSDRPFSRPTISSLRNSTEDGWDDLIHSDWTFKKRSRRPSASGGLERLEPSDQSILSANIDVQNKHVELTSDEDGQAFLKMAVLAFIARLGVSRRWASRALRTSMPWAVVSGHAASSRAAAAIKIAFDSTIRFACNLKTIYAEAAIGLFQVISDLAVQSYRGIIFCCSSINDAVVAFAARSSLIGKPTLGAMRAGVAHADKGKSNVMQTIQQILVAARSAFGRVTPIHMAGLAASGACLFLLMTSWSDAPASKQSFVMMALPPKPLAISTKPSQHGPIAFEWPSFETLPDEFDPPSIADETPASSGVAAAPLVKTRQNTEARLVMLTLLADIEAIAGLGEFARAVRLVGLETLIEPGRPYTILVPSDAAFASLGQDRLDILLDPRGHDELRALLSNHILSERLEFRDIVGEIQSYLSLADQPIKIAATDVIKVEDASMIETDLRAANSVVHVIDKLLVPQNPRSSSPLPSAEGIGQASNI